MGKVTASLETGMENRRSSQKLEFQGTNFARTRFGSAGRFPSRPFWPFHPGWGIAGNAREGIANKMRIVIKPYKCFIETLTSNKTIREILAGFPLSTNFLEGI
jgi:hypothetical protein